MIIGLELRSKSSITHGANDAVTTIDATSENLSTTTTPLKSGEQEQGLS